MRGYLIDYQGNKYRLPVLLEWSCVYGLGTPCDAFEISCIYDPEMAAVLPKVYRFQGEWNGKTQFYGVVDEYEVTMDEKGSLLHISGRGLAALLIDNESQAIEYGTCTLADILKNHVRVCGISNIKADAMAAVNGFTVESGTSQWSVLCEFASFAGGITPYFTKTGTLVLSGAPGQTRTMGGNYGKCDIAFRERRYGVISEVLIKNKAANREETVYNTSFKNRGGSCRRVVNVPRKAGYDTMRYTGEYQIRKSAEDSVLLQMTIPELFILFPNDILKLNMESKIGFSGTYKVREAEVWADANGSGTRLEMVPQSR